jgi:hypothetical protein
MDQTKACPFCAETILAAAVKCKHCGSDVRADDGAFRPRLLVGIVPFFFMFGLKVIGTYYAGATNPSAAMMSCLVVAAFCIAIMSGLFRRKRWARDWGYALAFLYAAGAFWDIATGRDDLGHWGVAFFGIAAGLSLLAIGSEFPQAQKKTAQASSAPAV